MKRVFILLSLLAVFTAACQKRDAAERGDDFSDAPWAVNTSLQVPIAMGLDNLFDVKTDSKAAVNSLSGVKFGVLAVDLNADPSVPETEDWSVLLKDKIATLGAGGWSQFVKPNGDPVTYYYPLETAYRFNYSFYAYRTSDAEDESAFAINDDFTKEVALGSTDVLWAKSEATEMPDFPGVTGFNSDYIRKARAQYFTAWSSYAPSLHFSHLTTALHFYVVAETAAAEATLKEVSVTDLVLSQVYTSATLDVTTGALTEKGEKGNLTMVDQVVPAYNGGEGAEYGEGFFILPGTEAMTVNFTIRVPDPQAAGGYREYRRETPYSVTPPSGGFVAGRAYRFRILVKEMMNLSAQLSLEDWQTDENIEVIDPFK